MRGLLLLVSCLVAGALGHGRLMNPPSRASQWRFGWDNPKDYNDNQGFCGGWTHQHVEMGGKCGVCGDPWDASPRQHEAPGGMYSNGNIVANYKRGQDVDVAIEITTNHKGHFTFRLCPNNNIHQDASQDCFDKYVLNTHGVEGSGEQYPITRWDRGFWNLTVSLPPEVTCSQCILQWTYTAGNNWGTDPDGTQCTGCGPQETFRACSDISIQPNRKLAKLLPLARN